MANNKQQRSSWNALSLSLYLLLLQSRLYIPINKFCAQNGKLLTFWHLNWILMRYQEFIWRTQLNKISSRLFNARYVTRISSNCIWFVIIYWLESNVNQQTFLWFDFCIKLKEYWLGNNVGVAREWEEHTSRICLKNDNLLKSNEF